MTFISVCDAEGSPLGTCVNDRAHHRTHHAWTAFTLIMTDPLSPLDGAHRMDRRPSTLIV